MMEMWTGSLLFNLSFFTGSSSEKMETQLRNRQREEAREFLVKRNIKDPLPNQFQQKNSIPKPHEKLQIVAYSYDILFSSAQTKLV